MKNVRVDKIHGCSEVEETPRGNLESKNYTEKLPDNCEI